MGLLDGLLGNETEVDAGEVQEEFAKLLAPGERVERAYQIIRDLIFFTDRRLVVVDKQGLTARKVVYRSIPYRSITHFSVETVGHFDLDAELKIWVIGESAPIQHRFSRKVSIYQVQSVLAAHLPVV